MNNIKMNKRSSLRYLLNIVQSDVRTTTGGNLRKIFLDTGVQVIPGLTNKANIGDFQVYKYSEEEQWRLPLLVSLLEIRNDNWEVLFDDDGDDENHLDENDLKDMIEAICTD